jgi:hypothetical protein
MELDSGSVFQNTAILLMLVTTILHHEMSQPYKGKGKVTCVLRHEEVCLA